MDQYISVTAKKKNETTKNQQPCNALPNFQGQESKVNTSLKVKV